MTQEAHDSSPLPAHEVVPTLCGRRLTVGRMRLEGLEHPAPRVVLDVEREPYDRDEVWASLTPAEARQLAAALLAQAAAVDRAVLPSGAVTGTVGVDWVDGESYVVTVRGHSLLVDQPRDLGGRDAAATPTELLVASLASCVAFYAGRYLSRHGVARDGLHVVAQFDLAAGRPARVAAIRLTVSLPDALPAERRAALLAVASRCTVHNTLTQRPEISIGLG